jgi:hypothetical protein
MEGRKVKSMEVQAINIAPPPLGHAASLQVAVGVKAREIESRGIVVAGRMMRDRDGKYLSEG